MLKINKPSGITINDLAKKIKDDRGFKKVCFCGRLDPMARGQIILLINDECKKVSEFLGKDKTYQFEIIFGFQTDSDDPLGIVQNTCDKYDYNEIKKQLVQLFDPINFPKKFEQQFHSLSSKRIDGKALWAYHQEGIKLDVMPTHIVEIKELKILNELVYNFNNLRGKIIKTIDNIDRKHIMRQDKIIKQWEQMQFENVNSILIEITVSAGVYVRQFVRDLSDKIKFPLMVYDINRISINL